ncbi:MAG: class I SAM-dependent methyltransferase [Propionibacteriaceae bacterium]|nr:class I SAM-dependent methyltransferase [Propionibacteriaceae bacterium]
MTPDELLATWHAQQTAFIEFRDLRTRAMLDVIAALSPQARPHVLDLGCGPGSLAAAVADRFPQATVVGVDRDPILLRLAEETNTHGARVRYVDADLTDPSWVNELGPDRFDAVVSATALHWLDPDQLARLYLSLPPVLNSGAVFLNADHLYFDGVTHYFLHELSENYRESFRVDQVESGAMTWERWWDEARAMPGWEQEAALWHQRWEHKTTTTKVDLEFHLSLLRAAGFVETSQIFQWFDDRVVFARMP